MAAVAMRNDQENGPTTIVAVLIHDSTNQVAGGGSESTVAQTYLG